MMSEKQVIVTLEDGFGRVQTSIATSLSAPQLMDKIMEIDEQQDIITELNKQIEQLHLAIDDLLSHTSCEEIKKENEQLKKEYKIAIDEMVTDYKKLEKENEMLRILLKDIYVDDELRKLAERYGVENE